MPGFSISKQTEPESAKLVRSFCRWFWNGSLSKLNLLPPRYFKEEQLAFLVNFEMQTIQIRYTLQ